MSLDLNDFKTDTTKENEGVEVPLGGGTWIRVASTNSEAYIKRLGELLEGNQLIMDMGGDAADELAKEALYKAASEHILKDWNMTVDGEPVEYTPEVGVAAFNDAPRFYKMVKEHADGLSLFAIEREEKETGN